MWNLMNFTYLSVDLNVSLEIYLRGKYPYCKHLKKLYESIIKTCLKLPMLYFVLYLSALILLWKCKYPDSCHKPFLTLWRTTWKLEDKIKRKKCLAFGCKPQCCIFKGSYRYGKKLLLQNGPHLSQFLPPIYITQDCLWWVSASFLTELVTKKHNDWHLLFWKRCDLFQLKTEWTVKWNWDAWRTPENTEISLSAHFVWQATITACILWEKEKKSLIVITCHQTSWCDNPSVCSSHRFVAQNQRHDSSV